MRDHPEGIRSVVLDSVLPTTYNVAENWQNARDGFDNIFQACAAEPACNAAHPHLERTFTGLVNKLEAEPLTATVKDPATGEDIKVVIEGGARQPLHHRWGGCCCRVGRAGVSGKINRELPKHQFSMSAAVASQRWLASGACWPILMRVSG
jgi:hypothetical protein